MNNPHREPDGIEKDHTYIPDFKESLNQSVCRQENHIQDLASSSEQNLCSEPAGDELELRKQVKNLSLELLTRNSRIATLETQLNEALQSKKELNLDVDTLEAQLGIQKERISMMKLIAISIMVVISVVMAVWIMIKWEIGANEKRIMFLSEKQFRTIEEAVELQWRASNRPPGLLANWDRPSYKYYLQLCNKKVIEKWASIEVAMIYRQDRESSLSEYYLLKKDEQSSWCVIDHAIKFKNDTDPLETIPEDIKRQLGW